MGESTIDQQNLDKLLSDIRTIDELVRLLEIRVEELEKIAAHARKFLDPIGQSSISIFIKGEGSDGK